MVLPQGLDGNAAATATLGAPDAELWTRAAVRTGSKATAACTCPRPGASTRAPETASSTPRGESPGSARVGHLPRPRARRPGRLQGPRSARIHAPLALRQGTCKAILCDSIAILAHVRQSCATVMRFWHMAANPVRQHYDSVSCKARLCDSIAILAHGSQSCLNPEP